MNATLVATLAGLITALCWGSGDWLSAKSAKKLSTQQVNLAVQVAPVVTVLTVFLFSDFQVPTLHQAVAIASGGVLITVAYLFFLKALSGGSVGVIVPIGNGYPLVTILLSILVLSDTFSGGQIMAMVGIVIGASILAYEKNTRKIPIRELHRDTFFAVAAALTWGLAFFIQDTVVKDLNWQTIYVVMETTTTAFTCLMFVAVYRSKTITKAKRAISYKPAIWAGVIGTTGFISFYVGSSRAGSLIIPTVLSACGPLVASGLGAVFDKERLGALKRAGAVIVVAGIIVLNVT